MAAGQPVAEAKAALRRRILAARRAGTGPGAGWSGTWPPGSGQRRGGRAPDWGGAVARQVLALPEIVTATCVAAFVSLPGEPSTLPLLEALRARGTRVLLPSVREDLDLDFREFTGTLVPGALGTREPPPAAPLVELARADAVLVPAVAVDPLGHRLGRGGGSYDRALARVRPGAPLIAVVDDLGVVADVPVDAHDQSVSVIVTPARTLRCRPR
ncbi:MAG: 5-formyltetrahydrofolate cyclo-ligase [Frankia sp.]|nr:5-formyltetrahydrofolate cyclo-ligase [Frankia sp.]